MNHRRVSSGWVSEWLGLTSECISKWFSGSGLTPCYHLHICGSLCRYLVSKFWAWLKPWGHTKQSGQAVQGRSWVWCLLSVRVYSGTWSWHNPGYYCLGHRWKLFSVLYFSFGSLYKYYGYYSTLFSMCVYACNDVCVCVWNCVLFCTHLSSTWVCVWAYTSVRPSSQFPLPKQKYKEKYK